MCGGSGVTHCCEGDCAQPDKATEKSDEPCDGSPSGKDN
jgi:hypothetical protein